MCRYAKLVAAISLGIVFFTTFVFAVIRPAAALLQALYLACAVYAVWFSFCGYEMAQSDS